MTVYLDPEDVDAWVERSGFHYRDRSLLLSSLASPMPVFGEEVYSGLHVKAAVLLSSLNRNHPLLDGNKRLSWLVTAAFYELNDVDLAVEPQQEIDRFVRSIAAADDVTIASVAEWLEGHAYRL